MLHTAGILDDGALQVRQLESAQRVLAPKLQGTLALRIEGKEPRRLSAGEAYHNPKGVLHETRNVGEGIARVASTFVCEKGKPLARPAE